MPRALFSVWNKTGIVELAQSLVSVGWDIVATGRTADILGATGVTVTSVEQLTGVSEMLGGRVKTLHPAIHAPILARDHSKDMSELTSHGYAPIDLVVCNLYPFQQTISQPSTTLSQAVEQIDIGGVTLIRAAAKNFERVIVVVDPDDYDKVQVALIEAGHLSIQERRNLAIKAFAHTRDYDTAIYSYLVGDNLLDGPATAFGDYFSIGLTRTQSLRYGENPHQQAALYAIHADTGPLGGTLLQGKPLSYNNLLDASAAYQAVSAFDMADKAAVVIIKHMNPTGVAVADTIAGAIPQALASDPVSAFGGIVAVNREVDAEFVRALGGLFVEVLIAPAFTNQACEMLAEGRKNCRLIAVNDTHVQKSLEFRSIQGGVLVQELDVGDPESTEWQVVTRRHPTPEEVEALKFAWTVVQHVRSNAIVLAGPTTTYGIGGGLPSRVDAVKLAVEKAGEHSQGAVLASDAFFPFADALQIAIDVGVTAVIQPGGSLRDQEIIDVADEAGLAMIFTKVRHFRH